MKSMGSLLECTSTNIVIDNHRLLKVMESTDHRVMHYLCAGSWGAQVSEHVFTDNFLRACFVPSAVPNIINITKSLLTKACVMDKYNAETILCRQDNEYSCDLICWYGDFPGEWLRICQPVVWEDPTFHRATKHCAPTVEPAPGARAL